MNSALRTPQPEAVGAPCRGGEAISDRKRRSAKGRGETPRLAKPSDCKRNQSRGLLVACLPPDRSMDVAVTRIKPVAAKDPCSRGFWVLLECNTTSANLL